MELDPKTLNEEGAAPVPVQLFDKIPEGAGTEGDDDDWDDETDDNGDNPPDPAAPSATPPASDDNTPPKDEDEDSDEDEDKGGEEEDETPTIVDHLSQEFGEIDFGENTEFDTEADAAKFFVTELIKKKTNDIGVAAVEQLFKVHPEVQQLVEHLQAGQSLDTFLLETSRAEFKPIDLESATEDQKLAVIRLSLADKGVDEEDIETTLEGIRDAGKVDARAAKAQDYLDKKYKDQIESKKKAEREAAAAREKQLREINEKVEEILNSGNLGVVTLPKEKTKELKQFIYSVDAEGNSLREQAWEKLTLEKRLLIDYLVATDFKDMKFGSSAVAAAKVNRNIKIKNATRAKVDLASSSGGSGGDKVSIKDFLSNLNK
jgi:hypothetical protein